MYNIYIHIYTHNRYTYSYDGVMKTRVFKIILNTKVTAIIITIWGKKYDGYFL